MAKRKGDVILKDWRGHCVSVPEGSSVEERLRRAGYTELVESKKLPQPKVIQPEEGQE